MKIEMGESLVLSWLRHAKNCQSVQMNWKPSTTSWELQNEELVEQLMLRADSYYNNKYDWKLFKNNRSYSQLIKQGEIDVLGLEVKNGAVENIYGIDIAFHENGLNYGTTEETIKPCSC